MNDFPLDCHTHKIENIDSAIVSGSPDQVEQWLAQFPQGRFSVGIHPWDTESLMSDSGELRRQMALLDELASHDRVVAIGETGLDGLRGAPIVFQEEIFKHHIELGRLTGKPIVVHVVRGADRLFRLAKENADIAMIWHGFRGKPQQAKQWLDLSPNNYISLGEKFNGDTAAIIPSSRLLFETDESALPIESVVARVKSNRSHA